MSELVDPMPYLGGSVLRNVTLPSPGSLIAGKYQVVRELGAGGMGVVYEAINRATEKRVALKFLSAELSSAPDCQARFEREAKATGRIHHPNVVSVHDYGSHDGYLYMVLELLRGVSLREWIAGRAVPFEAACEVLIPVMRGVAGAHAVGVLHRDLKPDNIFLCEMPDGLEPVPKVLDFGLAKLLAAHDDKTQLSVAGVAMGTYQFMAPEQLRAQGDEDVRTDVYALGAILFSMIAGRLPYSADNPVDLALQILESEPPLLSSLADVPASLAAAVARALSLQPAARFASVEAFALALEPSLSRISFRGAGRSSSSAPVRAPAGLTEAISVRALSTPFRSQDLARAEAQKQGLPSTPAASRPARWPWVISGAALTLSLVMVVGARYLLPDHTMATLPAASAPVSPSTSDAPAVTAAPSTAAVRPQAPLPADDGLTFVEPVPAPAVEEPQQWPDNRPELKPNERHSSRSARARSERTIRARGTEQDDPSAPEAAATSPLLVPPEPQGSAGQTRSTQDTQGAPPAAKSGPAPRSKSALRTDEF